MFDEGFDGYLSIQSIRIRRYRSSQLLSDVSLHHIPLPSFSGSIFFLKLLLVLRKVNNEDIVTVDLNVLCDCFPKVGVLDEA